jgi:hypothetical protein
MADVVTRTVGDRTERLLLEMPSDPDAQDAATIMLAVAVAYPDLTGTSFVKQPGGPLQVWVPTGMRPRPVRVAPADDW